MAKKTKQVIDADNEVEVEMDLDGTLSYVDPIGVEGKDWKWKVKDKIWVDLDGEGRELPCCEYTYSKGGDDNEI